MVQFQNITKIYEPDTVALENISFKIKEGEFLIIAGRSGAGKTTLLKLILAEEDPTKGKIIFEGKEINKIKKGELPFLRRKIGAVFQDYKLLESKTIYENVAFVLEVIGATDEEISTNVLKVLEIVGLQNKADNFPKEISAGERQRAAIARALIRNPKILILDEATSSLDSESERLVQGALEKLIKGRTTFIIAHRLSTVRKADLILVLEKGKIVEKGTHKELIKKKGLYHKFYSLQFQPTL